MTIIGSDSGESFFGYYDKSPINKDGRYLIYQESSHPTQKKPLANRSIDIVKSNNPHISIIDKSAF